MTNACIKNKADNVHIIIVRGGTDRESEREKERERER